MLLSLRSTVYLLLHVQLRAFFYVLKHAPLPSSMCSTMYLFALKCTLPSLCLVAYLLIYIELCSSLHMLNCISLPMQLTVYLLFRTQLGASCFLLDCLSFPLRSNVHFFLCAQLHTHSFKFNCGISFYEPNCAPLLSSLCSIVYLHTLKRSLPSLRSTMYPSFALNYTHSYLHNYMSTRVHNCIYFLSHTISTH